MKIHIMKRRLSLSLIPTFLSFILTTATLNCQAQDTPNSRQARRMFDRTYQMVFGPQGSTLQYDVNIIGILKTNGRIWYKGKKSKFVESRYCSWNDGVKDTWVDLKKKTVTVYDADSERKDKYMSKFTFNADDYSYYVIDGKNEGYIITLEAKKGVKGIKHLKAIIDKTTRAPISLKIKVLWFWTTVKISHFQSGNVSDDIFKFPAEKYKSYTIIDERGK